MSTSSKSRRWSGPLIRGVAGLALLITGLAVKGQTVLLILGGVLVLGTIAQLFWMARSSR
jgi:hypothetical protein